MEFAPPACQIGQQSSCTEADWVQCSECSRLVCTTHEEVEAVRHSGKHAAKTSWVCGICVRSMFERGEMVGLRNGHQFIYKR